MTTPRTLVAAAAFCALLVAVRAVAPNANCDLLYDGTPISDSSWASFYNASRNAGGLKDDTSPGQVYLALETQEVTGSTYSSESPYIDVQLDTTAKTLSLVVTDAFTGYEEDMISASDASTININLRLSCSDGNTASLNLKISVEDVNNHRPQFAQSSYECILPMPLPPDIDISSFLVDINVQDIDFSNNAISIGFDEVGDQLFRAEAIDQGNRNYVVRLYSKARIDLKETTKFSMTAVDGGTPPLTSDPATIVISPYSFKFRPQLVDFQARAAQEKSSLS